MTAPQESDPPTCSSCRHFQCEGMLCCHPELLGFDAVRGRVPQPVNETRLRGACGVEGVLWEPVLVISESSLATIALACVLVVGLLAWVFR